MMLLRRPRAPGVAVANGGGDAVVADGREAGDDSSAGAPVDAEEPVGHVAPGHGGEELSVLSDDSEYELIDVDPTTVEGVRAWFC